MFRVNRLNAGVWGHPDDDNLHLRRVVPKRNFEINLHYLFFVNSAGSGFFSQFTIGRYNKNGKIHNAGDPKFIHRSVDKEEVIRSLRQRVIPFMIETGSSELVWDGARCQHTDNVHEFGRDLTHADFPELIPKGESYDIIIHPSAQRVRNDQYLTQTKVRGYPGNSHDCNSPCEVAFASLQYRIGRYFVLNPSECTMTRLHEKCGEEWSKLFPTCQKLIAHHHRIIREIRDCGRASTKIHNGFLENNLK